MLSSIPYEKNMHGNKNDDFFSIIHSCPTSRCTKSEWGQIKHSFFEKMRYRFLRYYGKEFSIKECKWNQKVK